MLHAVRRAVALLALIPAVGAAQPVQTASFREVMLGNGFTMTSWREDVGDGTSRHWLAGTTVRLGGFGFSTDPHLISVTLGHSFRLYIGSGLPNYLLYAVSGSDPQATYDFATAPIITATGAPLPWFSPGAVESGSPYALFGRFISSYQAIYHDGSTGGTFRDQDIIDGGLAFRMTTTAPEPSTWALMGTGLLALGGVAARRRKRSTA